MNTPRLSNMARRRIAAEVRGSLTSSDGQVYADDARVQGEGWVRPAKGSKLAADFLLVKAVDRYMAGDLSEEELYRIRCIAFYMVFAVGGEEWQRMGVAFGMSMGRPDTGRKLPKLTLPNLEPSNGESEDDDE